MRSYYGNDSIKDKNILFGAFDTETKGLGGDLLMVQYGTDSNNIIIDTSENKVGNFIDYIMDFPEPFVWFAHFAQYDWRYFMKEITDRRLKVYFNMRDETNVYQIIIKRDDKKKVIMRDSFALWNSTLEDMADCFCPELPKEKIDILNFNPNDPKHIHYAKRDVQILLTALPRLFNMLHDNFSVTPNSTTASTALKAWQKSMPDGIKFSTSKYDEREQFIRQSYYGGLVFLTNTNTQKNCLTFDVNSSYPSVMRDYGVPYGACGHTTDYQTEKMGIYRVKIKAPDNLIIPIIPARDKRGNMRWFRGTFETTVTNAELIFALKHGYKLLQLYEGLIWDERIFPFSDFISHCKNIRDKFKHKPQERLAKLMQNSLYGKFGSKRERAHLYASYMMNDEDFIGSMKYDDDGLYCVKTEFEDSLQCKPEWAVFITAHARLKLLQNAYSIGVEHVYYGDTDSLTVDSKFKGSIDVGPDYGQFKLEKKWREFRAIAPKVYSGILENGKLYAAAKGVPRKAFGDNEKRALLLDGKIAVKTESLSSFRVALKNGIESAKPMLRKSTDISNCINFDLLQNGKVRPKMAA